MFYRALWNLELCGVILPQLKNLLASNYERYSFFLSKIVWLMSSRCLFKGQKQFLDRVFSVFKIAKVDDSYRFDWLIDWIFFSSYIESASASIKLILKNFAQLIKNTLSIPPGALGVDLSREERYIIFEFLFLYMLIALHFFQYTLLLFIFSALIWIFLPK